MSKLVYFEDTNDANAAIAREKQIKGWLRVRKLKLIETMNPGWIDLSAAWYEAPEKIEVLRCAQDDKESVMA
jgi:putative endonuclease